MQPLWHSSAVADDSLIFDVAIVGGGPAGLAAATWLGRFRRSVVLFDSGEYRNRWTSRAHGYLGSDPVDPAELRRAALRDLEQYERISMLPCRVDAVETRAEGFVTRARGEEYESRRLILATGVVDAFPLIDGFEEHYGADVFHCPLCDGFESRGKHVVMLGFSEDSARSATGLLNWAASVTLIAQNEAAEDRDGYREASGDPAVDVIWARPVRFIGARGHLKGITLDSGKSVPCDVAFFSTGNYPKSELADQLGCKFTEEDCVEVDQDCMTSVRGAYAAGDLTPGPHLLQVAAAKGAIAGSACAESLLA